jgi:hypothetical protein
MEMGLLCGGIDQNKAKQWLEGVIYRLGEAMSQCSRVELNLGIGTILCINQTITHQLLPRQTVGIISYTCIASKVLTMPLLHLEANN